MPGKSLDNNQQYKKRHIHRMTNSSINWDNLSLTLTTQEFLSHVFQDALAIISTKRSQCNGNNNNNNTQYL